MTGVEATQVRSKRAAHAILKDHGVRIERGVMGHRIYRGVSEVWDIYVDGYTTRLWILGRTMSSPMDHKWDAENFSPTCTDIAVARFLLACDEDAS